MKKTVFAIALALFAGTVWAKLPAPPPMSDEQTLKAEEAKTKAAEAAKKKLEAAGAKVELK